MTTWRWARFASIGLQMILYVSALGLTPAMAAGITDHVWKVQEIVALLDQKDSKPKGDAD